MHKITLDFETRSKLSVKDVGAYRYASDPSTDILCLAYKIPGEEIKLWSRWDFENPEDLFTAMGKYPVEAHNAGFEWCIWNEVGVKKYGWPALQVENLFCSAAKAAALALPRALKNLAGALGSPIEKDMKGHRLMLQLSRPRKPSKKDPSPWWETPEKLSRLYEYCKTDVLVEEEVSSKMKELTEMERRVWLLDHKMNTRGVYCDIPNVERAIRLMDSHKETLNEELSILTEGEITSGGQRDRILSYLKENEGLELPDLQAPTIEVLLNSDSLPEKARKILSIRASLSKSSTSKLTKMLMCADKEDFRIRGTLLYHGATTGRFSGRLIQPHNYPKGFGEKELNPAFEALEMDDIEFFKFLYPNVNKTLSNMLRGFLRAAPGKDLIVADFSGIEARVLAWIAGDKALCEKFAKGADIYKEMAAAIYGKKVSEITKAERQLGKVAILGLGYGMGWKKFIETCNSWGIEISEALAKKTVKIYRTKYHKTPTLWAAVEQAFTRAIYMGTLETVGGIKFKKQGSVMYVKLPSGRKLSYPFPRIKTEETKFGPKASPRFMGTDTYTKKWCEQSTYGGKLVENIVQGIARDFMVESMFRVEEANYPLIMSVHDELISEVDEDFGSVKEFEDLMVALPSWGMGCPIGVEGWRGKRYRK